MSAAAFLLPILAKIRGQKIRPGFGASSAFSQLKKQVLRQRLRVLRIFAAKSVFSVTVCFQESPAPAQPTTNSCNFVCISG
jgi:hypothetical protein